MVQAVQLMFPVSCVALLVLFLPCSSQPLAARRAYTLEQMEELFPCGDDYACSAHGECQWRPPLEEQLKYSTIHGSLGTGSGCLCAAGYAARFCQVKCPVGNWTVADTPNGTVHVDGQVCSGKDAGECSPLNGTCQCTNTNNMETKGTDCAYQCPRGLETCVLTRLGIVECTPQVCSGFDMQTECPPPYATAGGLLPWPCTPVYIDETLADGTVKTISAYSSKRGVCEFKQSAALNPLLDSYGCHETHAFKDQCQHGITDPYTGLSIGGTSCRCRYDVRGWNCTLDCRKDPLGRICSHNGTCTEEAECICNQGYFGETCEYKILNETYLKYPLDSTQVVTGFNSRICIRGPKRQKNCRFDLDCGYDCAPGLTNCFNGWTDTINLDLDQPGPSGDELLGVDYGRCRDATGLCRRKFVFKCVNVEVCDYGEEDQRTEEYLPCISSDWARAFNDPVQAQADGLLPLPCDTVQNCVIDTRNCTRDSDEPRACIAQFSVRSETFDSSTRVRNAPPPGEVVGGLVLRATPSQVLELQYEHGKVETYPPFPTARALASMSSASWEWILEGWPAQKNTVFNEHLVLMFGGAGRPETNIVMITNSKTLIEEPEIVTQQAISSEVWRWNHTICDEPQFLFNGFFATARKANPATGKYLEGMEFGHWQMASPTPFEERSAIPPKRYGHTLTLINNGQSALLFGGYSTVCADYCKDLWEYHFIEGRWSFKNMTPAASFNPVYRTKWDVMDVQNLTKWESPPKRWQHTMTVRSQTSIILFGGFFTQGIGEGWLNDVWEYKFEKAPQTKVCINYDIGKGPNYRPPSCPDQADDTGYWIQHFNATHHHKNGMDIANSGPMVEPRRGHAAAFVDGFLYVFGGQVRNLYNVSEEKGRVRQNRYKMVNDIWQWSYENKTWRDITAIANRKDGIPPPRVNMASMTFRDHFVISGGFMDPEYYNDLWSFNATTLSWIQNSYAHRNFLLFWPKPEKRSQHSMAYSGGQFLIFGGIGQNCVDEYPGASETAPLFCMDNDQTPLLFYGDSWVWRHDFCPDECNGNGACNVGFCMCDQSLGGGHWGYHCGYQMCHNSTCAWDFDTQHEYCTHCHEFGHCEGFSGRCHCIESHQHILPKNYNEESISTFGQDLEHITEAPVKFYSEDPDFHMDERRRKDCLYVKCPHQFCSGHGYCTPNGTCHCEPEFIGTGCEYHAYCPTKCKYQGYCEPKLLDNTTPWAESLAGSCECYDVFNGTSCKIAKRNCAYAQRIPCILVYLLLCVLIIFQIG